MKGGREDEKKRERVRETLACGGMEEGRIGRVRAEKGREGDE